MGVVAPGGKKKRHTHYRHIPFHFPHNEHTPVQISFQYLRVRIIKEIPGSGPSGTLCITIHNKGFSSNGKLVFGKISQVPQPDVKIFSVSIFPC